MSMTQLRSLVMHGRRVAEELMIDRGMISRAAEIEPTIDPDTLELTVADDVDVTAVPLPCRVKAPDHNEQTAIFGDEEVTEQRFVISFPASCPTVKIGDIVTVSSVFDPQIASRVFRVVAVESRTFLHSRRVGVEVIG